MKNFSFQRETFGNVQLVYKTVVS